MTDRATRPFNFFSGPAVLPPEVLLRAAEEMTAAASQGMSVMEISHRSAEFGALLAKAEGGLRELIGVPTNYQILFLQGGATLQFSMVPMNLLPDGAAADYVVTGSWGKKAVAEARRYGDVNTIFSGADSGFRSVPSTGAILPTSGAAYLHYTSNETIDGVEFDHDLEGNGVPIVCDMSSNILSRPMDISKYDLIYAGAQKNIGPSGVTVVIIRDDLLETCARDLPDVLTYKTLADHGSMVNTPNTWGVYMIGLICDWLKAKGGVEAIAKVNARKAATLYAAIDSSDGFYEGHAEISARSKMNVTFRLPSPDLEDKFCSETEALGLVGLRGHRSVGGIRASIYNAFPEAGVDALVGFMKDFAATNG